MPNKGFQTIAATMIVSGPQTVHIDTHGTGGAGSYISVSTPNLIISVHNRAAAAAYTKGWIESGEWTLQLPSYRRVEVETLADKLPGVVVRAYGHDKIRATYVAHRQELQLRIGYLTWIVVDHEAHESMRDAWITVREMARLVLPDTERHL